MTTLMEYDEEDGETVESKILSVGVKGTHAKTLLRIRYKNADSRCSFNSNFRPDYHKGKSGVPDTRNTEDGSARRNIARKHDHDPHR